jgi:hypothetical protein
MSQDKSKEYRHRYSLDLKELDDIIQSLANKENRGKANMAKLLIKEALIARKEIID